MAYISVCVSLACIVRASGGAPTSVLHPAPALGAHPLSFAISLLGQDLESHKLCSNNSFQLSRLSYNHQFIEVQHTH